LLLLQIINNAIIIPTYSFITSLLAYCMEQSLEKPVIPEIVKKCPAFYGT